MTRQTVAPSGLVVAAIGFVLTRVTVSLTVIEGASQFYFTGIVPLVLGLGLAAFGVVLTVGAYEREFVRTVARWCVLGTAGMFVLVVFTLLGSQTTAIETLTSVRSQAYLSNFPIGGAVGGTLTGVYAARNRHQQSELQRRANRLVLLNRLLRDKIINAATAIRGHNEMLKQSYNENSVEVIERQADAVIENIENIKYLVGSVDDSARTMSAIDLDACLGEVIAEVSSEHPDVQYEFTGDDERVCVRANRQLWDVFAHLVENAAEYSDPESPRVTVAVVSNGGTATVRVQDNGPGLPANQQALLEDGEIAEFDDPRAGFGLKIVRLLVEHFEGAIRTTVTDEGTTVEVDLPRIDPEIERSGEGAIARALTAGVVPSRIVLAIVASLVAGLVMGTVMIALGDLVPVIGALYGIENLVVGWISHEFHSVVFGLAFAAIVSATPRPGIQDPARRLGIGVGLGLTLWFFAAGIVMPVWLRLVGVPAPIPTLTVPGLIGHVAWGLTLAGLYHAGDRWLRGRDAPLVDR